MSIAAVGAPHSPQVMGIEWKLQSRFGCGRVACSWLVKKPGRHCTCGVVVGLAPVGWLARSVSKIRHNPRAQHDDGQDEGYPVPRHARPFRSSVIKASCQLADADEAADSQLGALRDA